MVPLASQYHREYHGKEGKNGEWGEYVPSDSIIEDCTDDFPSCGCSDNTLEDCYDCNQTCNGDYFIDEVRVWNTDLTQNQIQAWMHKTLDTSHDNYSNSTSDNLKVYFHSY